MIVRRGKVGLEASLLHNILMASMVIRFAQRILHGYYLVGNECPQLYINTAIVFRVLQSAHTTPVRKLFDD